MKEPMKYTITLDDCEQIDDIVRLHLINALDNLEYDDEYTDPELAFAMLKVLESFCTKEQWACYLENKEIFV